MCLSDPNGDPRPKRMIETIKKTSSVYVLSRAASYTGCVCAPIKKILTGSFFKKIVKTLLYLFNLNSVLEKLYLKANSNIFPGVKFDLIVCHDLETLPIAFANFKSIPVIFDAREFYPRQFEDQLLWRLLFQRNTEWLCSKYLKLCAKILTVSPGLVAGYSSRYHVDCELMLSLPDYVDIRPRKVDSQKIKIIHHGTANPSRKLELMIETARHLEHNFELHLMLVPQYKKYYNKLRALALGLNNVKFIDPVPFKEIIPTLATYDIGFFLCPLTTFNLKHALPNKLFEYIQARLALVVGPSPDMASVVSSNKLGIISESYNPVHVAKMINRMTYEDINEFKSKSDSVALEYSHQSNIALINRILANI